MMRNTSIQIVLLVMLSFNSSAQTQSLSQKLSSAIKQFQSDPQMRHAIMSICVLDAKTGKKVFAHNDQIGLAPASTQKIFTSAAAYELLGNSYQFKTMLGYTGKIENEVLTGHIKFIGSGDPTLGSWRYNDTKEDVVLAKFVSEIKKLKIKKITGNIGLNETRQQWPQSSIPSGWIWEDIGNYYGAGSSSINWRENQYDLILQAGDKVGDAVSLVRIHPSYIKINFYNELKTAAKNSGDNAYIYMPEFFNFSHVRGTIPLGEKQFVISGAMPKPSFQLGVALTEKIKSQDIDIFPYPDYREGANTLEKDTSEYMEPKIFYTHYSPPLDTLNYHFMRRSINLYGEALLKVIALEKSGIASTEKGVELLQDFYSKINIDKGAINIQDGSGLSPQNRVTTDAQVKVLQYAKSRAWFASFYHALPLYNGMKMKSGSIGGARAYAGYHTAKDGKEYIFSIIVNNYEGSGNDATRKLYKVLDVLK